MRRQFRFAVVAPALIALAVLGTSCSEDGTPFHLPGPAAITGTVLDHSGQPVAGAGILLEYTLENQPIGRALGDKPATQIRFDLPDPGPVRVWVTELCGGTVRVLIDGELPSGTHAIIWDGRDDDGLIVTPGVYTVRVETPEGQLGMAVYWAGGGWPPLPPLESREWHAVTDGHGRFTVPIDCLSFGESIVATNENGDFVSVQRVPWRTIVWAVHPDLGSISTPDFVAVDPMADVQVDLRFGGSPQ